jgi:hypothetical protein
VARIERNAGALSSALSTLNREMTAPPCLVLHYSGYGYERNGAPLWLQQGIDTYMKHNPEARFAVVFHELYATSPPWRRAFWHSRDQLGVARRLAEIADRALCATEEIRTKLVSWNGSLDVRVLPMPSNVGETPDPKQWERRASRLMVFGLPASRARLFKRRDELRKTCDALQIEAIDDVGAAIGLLPDLGRPIEQHGLLPASMVSKLASSLKFGALYNSAGNPSKSGVFACYCAHGVVPILMGGTCRSEGLLPGENYLSTSMLHYSAIPSLPSVAAAARSWYGGHRMQEHAAWLNSLLA